MAMPEPSTASNEGEPPTNAYVLYMSQVTKTLLTLAWHLISRLESHMCHLGHVTVHLVLKACVWVLKIHTMLKFGVCNML